MAKGRISPTTPSTAQHHQHARSPRSKRHESLKSLADADTLRALAWAVDASKRSVVPFAAKFIRGEDGHPAPLARLLRGGRGGDVRLKLYLSMNLLAAHEPYDVRSAPARVWAEMLGLPNPETTGARRINEAMTHLEQRRLINVSGRRQGKPVKPQLLSQAGDGATYSRPTKGYTNLPVAFWHNCWIVKLSGRAIALLLILLDHLSGQGGVQRDWIRPDDARARYGLSEDTWTRGVKELSSHGLVRVTREKHGERWEWVRLRNKYVVNVQRLDRPPG